MDTLNIKPPPFSTIAPAKVARPRLCFVGPMLGGNPGWVTSQGEILAGLLHEAGYPVLATSHIPARLPRLADTLRSLVAWRDEIDLVVHQVYSGPAFAVTDAASWLCRRLRLPQLFVLHGGALPEFAAARQGWVRRVLGRAERVVVPSGFLLERVVRPLFPDALPGWVRVIPNILEVERYTYRHRPAAAPRLLWMRTFQELYNPQMAVDALVDLRRTHPAATLTMAGQEKGLQAAVMAYAAALGLSEAVRFAGFLGPEAKAHEFAAHDIFLNTNRVDNMPVSVVEAAAFGLPIVATAVGGVPHLLRDGQTGLLVPDGDATAMAEAVRRLLSEPGLAAALSANGRQLAESCGWSRVRAQWESLFAEVYHARLA